MVMSLEENYSQKSSRIPLAGVELFEYCGNLSIYDCANIAQIVSHPVSSDLKNVKWYLYGSSGNRV